MNFSFTSGDATTASQPSVGGALRCAIADVAQVALATVMISSVTDAATGTIVRLTSTSSTNTVVNCSAVAGGDDVRRLSGFTGFSRAAVSAGFSAEMAIQIAANSSVADPSGTGASVISQQLAKANAIVALLTAAVSSGSILTSLANFAAALADSLGISAETVLAGESSTIPVIRIAIARSATNSPSPPPPISALLNTNTTAISVAVPLVVVFCLFLSFVVYVRRSRRYAEDHSLALALARKGVQSKFAPFSFNVNSREKRPVLSSEAFDVVEETDTVQTFRGNPIFSSRSGNPLEAHEIYGHEGYGATSPGTSRSPSAVLPPHSAVASRMRRNPILMDAEGDARAKSPFSDYILPHSFTRDVNNTAGPQQDASSDISSPQAAAVARMAHVLGALSRNRRVSDSGGVLVGSGNILSAASSPLGPSPSSVLPTASRIATLLHGGFRATGATSLVRSASTRNNAERSLFGDNDPTTNPTRFALGPPRY